MKKGVEYLQSCKREGHKITALTAYDAPTAALLEVGGIDMIFVGDSVGTNVLGYASEQEVTLADMVHHLRAVRRGSLVPFVLVDMPYNTYNTGPQALETAQILMAAGADGVKLEGDHPDVITTLVDHGIPVCGHLGLQPQTQQERTVQGKTLAHAQAIWQGSHRLAAAGAFALVLELIPGELAQLITQALGIPTIGIGCGVATDGQVLIIQDILGVNPRTLRLARRYQDFHGLATAAIRAYQEDVMAARFPTVDNSRPMPAPVLAELHAWLASLQR